VTGYKNNWGAVKAAMPEHRTFFVMTAGLNVSKKIDEVVG